MQRTRKIVVIGAECSGKSTLCQALSDSMGVPWVPEYAREYLEQIDRPYNETDLLEIAKGQLGLEDRHLATNPEFLICDTDLNVIKVWSEVRFENCDPQILQLIATRSYDLYLLAHCDLPWTADPLREHPDPADRIRFYREYQNIVAESGIPWATVEGNEAERLQQALAAIRSHIPST